MVAQSMQTYYQQLGGEQALRRLIDRFYDLMDGQNGSSEFANLIRRNRPLTRQVFMLLSG
jgi:truncated hemoglobin YjbI